MNTVVFTSDPETIELIKLMLHIVCPFLGAMLGVAVAWRV